jgi:hypothetical protein
MRRKTVVRIHIVATIIAVAAISCFFISSLVAEITRNEVYIRSVKRVILYLVPILLIVMPALRISGTKLCGKSQNPTILAKAKRMKFIFINGVCLIALACFLYYRSHYQSIDNIFIGAQLAEFLFGLTNLILIGLNIKSGFQLSGRLKKSKS